MNYDKDIEGTTAIYYYNEEANELEELGGNINEKAGTITIEVERFSTYGVFVKAAEEESQQLENVTPPKEDPKENAGKVITPNLNIEKGPVLQDSDKNPTVIIEGDKNNEVTDKAANGADKLPNTATPFYKFILFGVGLMLIGALMTFVLRRKMIL